MHWSSSKYCSRFNAVICEYSHRVPFALQCSLAAAEVCEVMKKWADHLQLGGTNQRCRSALALLSIGDIVRCVEMLASNQMIERAVLLFEAAMDAGFDLQWDKNKSIYYAPAMSVRITLYSRLDKPTAIMRSLSYRRIPPAGIVFNLCSLPACHREFRDGAQLLHESLGHPRG